MTCVGVANTVTSSTMNSKNRRVSLRMLIDSMEHHPPPTGTPRSQVVRQLNTPSSQDRIQLHFNAIFLMSQHKAERTMKM
ncbi:hypothetical protein CEP54_013974 [Fusarium duplospermum]|uniref:Uncharacterized protein n=1 Tax=Fusarium duplospermum TaxID=1325734 RepID=A0A428NZ82_9HYPO|nr:hypothetical protein CEP54_013974 [Fusarium duplospermum]